MRSLLLMLIALLLPLQPVSAAQPGTTVELKRLIGLKTLFRRINDELDYRSRANCSVASQHYFRETAQQVDSARSLRISQWQEFLSLASLVLGNGQSVDDLTYTRVCTVFSGEGINLSLRASGKSLAIDRLVERMLMLGYTPREITDVISGRITLRTLEQAQNMRALGYAETRINSYLERHYQGSAYRAQGSLMRAVLTKPSNAKAGPRTSERSRLERVVAGIANRYAIDANLVYAIIANESSWRTNAVSDAGAIGLMQLMPATARMLGVDPKIPEQNIEGGVRYLAGLLKMFKGDVDAAVVAYNAGPAHAMKWRKGDTLLYGETRTYLQRVKASYSHPSL